MQLPPTNEIQKRRDKLSLTQTQLAKKAGVSQSLIARIEAGTVDPRYSKVAKVFQALEELKGREIEAKEIMTRNVVGVKAENTIEQAASTLKEHGVSQMPVYDGENTIGSFSEKIIVDRISKGINMQQFSNEKVREHMDSAFPTVKPDTPLTIISALLEHNNAVLVQDAGKTAGIITNADLLKVLHK
ncbi:MAG: CBS domain-containing protein [Candidatus Altiarchaeota archaeon]|nr:CBS domain-containing protein [Candidatus Altiarchaeota archaeon]